MTNKSEVGKIGEDIAAYYLELHNCKIIDRNCRYVWGELDIVAKHKNGMLLIVEVKTVRGGDSFFGIKPEDNMTRAKIQKLRRSANFYANQNQSIYDPSRGWRIDFTSVILPKGFQEYSATNDLTSLYKNCEIKYIENVA